MINPPRPIAPPGTLREALSRRFQSALEAGHLEPIPTRFEVLEEGGVRFIVRVAESLARKRRAGRERAPDFNPFLPYEEALWVADLTDEHAAVLNRFNVLDEHLLIITRRFQPQTAPLDLADFEALARGLHEIDGLAFFNGGPEAGASQPHKHLQLVPLPLAPGERLPIEPALTGPGPHAPALPFRHAFARLDTRDASAALDAWASLLTRIGLDPIAPAPYNLLATRDWMMVVPRRAERSARMSINALGFAGALLTRDEEGLRRLKARSLMQLLVDVSAPGA